MTVIAILPILIALAGMALWFVSSNPKVSEVGRIAFACGLLVMCFSLANHVIKVG